MKILVDTNILLRASQPESPHFEICVKAVEFSPTAGFVACLVPQVIYEYWAVATRPIEQNGLGFSVEQAAGEIGKLASLFPVLRDERGIFEHWQNLVAKYDVKGKTSHDARLAAAMLRHRIDHLLTLNVADFAKFDTISVYEPAHFENLRSNG